VLELVLQVCTGSGVALGSANDSALGYRASSFTRKKLLFVTVTCVVQEELLKLL
jgi:hypothetical protein